MILNVIRNIECNNYSVLMSFSEYGTETLTPEDEQKLINDYCPKFKLSDIDFTGTYGLEGKKVVSNGSGETIKLSTANKSFLINNEFEIKYSISPDEIKEEEIQSTLNTKELICKAKIELFIDKVSEQIKKVINEKAEMLDLDYEEENKIIIGK